jgi:hypothetical protein
MVALRLGRAVISVPDSSETDFRYTKSKFFQLVTRRRTDGGPTFLTHFAGNRERFVVNTTRDASVSSAPNMQDRKKAHFFIPSSSFQNIMRHDVC